MHYPLQEHWKREALFPITDCDDKTKYLFQFPQIANQLRLAMHLKFAINVPNMRFDRVWRQEVIRCDVLIAFAGP